MNTCAWILIGGKTIQCQKNCRGKYCHIHNYRIKKGKTMPDGCLKCGKGTQSITNLCPQCGADAARHRLIYHSKKENLNFQKQSLLS